MKAIELAREAIKVGDIQTLGELIKNNPGLENDRSEDNDRTLLHTIADYPGHRMNGIKMAKLLIDTGADVDARYQHPRLEHVKETPLHWTASSDDFDLAELLLDEGANIDADQGVIANGTPLWNAAIFRCVHVANLLIERGAASNLMTAAAAGRMDLVEQYFDEADNVDQEAGAFPGWDEPRSPRTALNSAFGFACRNGHLTLARRLLDRGADPTPANPAGETPLKQAQVGGHRTIVDWLKQCGVEE